MHGYNELEKDLPVGRLSSGLKAQHSKVTAAKNCALQDSGFRGLGVQGGVGFGGLGFTELPVNTK